MRKNEEEEEMLEMIEIPSYSTIQGDGSENENFKIITNLPYRVQL